MNSKRLYRSRSERMIAGVCGGIGEYFNIDPTLIRLLFVVFALTGGSGLVAYIIFMIVVPEEPMVDMPQSAPEAPAPESPEE